MPAEAPLVVSWGIGLLVLSLFILHVGIKIERTLEVLCWFTVILVTVLLIIAAVIGTPAKAWADVCTGIFTPGFPIGVGLDWFVVTAAAAYIPAGFGFNLMLASYARDKGWGMGSRVGFISAVIGGKKVKISAEEAPFTVDEENLRRWKGWLRVLRIDSWIVMSFVTFITVLMTSAIAWGFVVMGVKPVPVGMGIVFAMGKLLTDLIGPIGWWMFLICAFVLLLDTQYGLMDSVSRVIMDNFWISSPRIRMWAKEDPRRLYYSILYFLFIVSTVIMIGMYILGWGVAAPYWLAAVGANFGVIALLIAYILQIIVNRRYLPKELKPHPLSTFILICGIIFYGFFLFALALQTLFGIRI